MVFTSILKSRFMEDPENGTVRSNNVTVNVPREIYNAIAEFFLPEKICHQDGTSLFTTTCLIFIPILQIF